MTAIVVEICPPGTTAVWAVTDEAAPMIADATAADIRKVCDFSAQVMAEDGAACELNQRGLHAMPHTRGMLMPEEYDVLRLHEWLRAQLGESR